MQNYVLRIHEYCACSIGLRARGGQWSRVAPVYSIDNGGELLGLGQVLQRMRLVIVRICREWLRVPSSLFVRRIQSLIVGSRSGGGDAARPVVMHVDVEAADVNVKPADVDVEAVNVDAEADVDVDINGNADINADVDVESVWLRSCVQLGSFLEVSLPTPRLASIRSIQGLVK